MVGPGDHHQQSAPYRPSQKRLKLINRRTDPFNVARLLCIPFPSGFIHFAPETSTRELLERDVRPGVDYALTEVVHCKSRKETGVPEALPECTRRYLQRVVKLSGARVLVTLGKRAKAAVQQEFNSLISPAGEEVVFGPIPFGERQRYIVFLPHPNAHMKRTFEASVGREKLQVLQAFLRSQIS